MKAQLGQAQTLHPKGSLRTEEKDWTWNQAFLRNLVSNSVTENSFSLNFLIYMIGINLSYLKDMLAE